MKNISRWLLPLYVLIISVAAFQAIRKPFYNWDMLAYIGSAYALETNDVVSLHKKTYEEVRNNVPADVYEQLISSQYRANAALDPGSFYQQLKFYQVKPLYVLVVCGFIKAGISPIWATVLPSAISYFLICFLIFFWLKKYTGTPGSFVISTLLAVSSFMINTARLSTPDLFSALFLIAGFYIYLEHKKNIPAIVLWLLSLAVRPDNIILLLVLLAFMRFAPILKEKISTTSMILAGVAALGIHFGVSLWVGSYGWKVLFAHTFVEKFSYPLQATPEISLLTYLKILGKWMMSISDTYLPVFLMIAALTCVKDFGKKIPIELETQLILLIALIIVVKFLLFPIFDDRFLITFYILLLMLSVRKFSGVYETIRNR